MPTPMHVLAECTTAQAAAAQHTAAITGVIANRGSGPWHDIDVLAARVQQLVESHAALSLGEALLSTRVVKVIQPQGQMSVEDVLRDGVVFKHALRPGGVLRDRDRAATQQQPGKRKSKGAKGHQAPQEDSITVIHIAPPPGRRGTRQIIPHRVVSLWDAFDPSHCPSSSFTRELWELCDRAEEASSLAAEQW